MRLALTSPVAVLLFAWGSVMSARGADGTGEAARVHNLKVFSNQTDDVSTVENILRSFLKPGMTDAERSEALWRAAVKYRHQSAPPNEFLAADWEAHDPVKIFNVYGYCMCCCSSAILEALNRADGREARGRILNGHSVPEVRFGDGWHMYDASLLTFFPKPGDELPASVDEIGQSLAEWYEAHPEYKKDRKKLESLMRQDGWNGWKTEGPALLARCPYYKQGFLPARTHGWSDTMLEYARKPSEVYEYGYQVGHRAVFSLRPGESFTREAGNRGLHVNQESDPQFEMLSAKAPQNDLVYLKEAMPGYQGGVVANGVQRYAPELNSEDLALGAEQVENLTTGGSPALRPKDTAQPALAVIEMTSPYVYLAGRISLKGVRKADADRLTIAISTDNGRTYEPLWTADRTGNIDATIDISSRILRRYAYRLLIEIQSSGTQSCGLDTLTIENDFQHAPRTLPWLAMGSNTITVSADRDTAIASQTIACRITPDASYTRNETTRTMGVVFDNLDVRDGSCWWKNGVGTMTVPVTVPGDLVALRVCAQIRARGAKDRIKLRTSVDQGKSWNDAGEIAGPTPGTTRRFAIGDWPRGTRAALLRFELSGNNTIGIFSFRVDADYRDARAVGELRPFTVEHRWREGSASFRSTREITALPTSYEIVAGSEPDMDAVIYAMPSTRKK